MILGELNIAKSKDEFDKFLKTPTNYRIIFSGPFGSGKTYFLRKFFENNNNYIGAHLFPTNYTTSKNEDVFELIKFDLIHFLLSTPILLEKIDVTLLETMPYAGKELNYKIFQPFIELIPKVGKSISSIIESLSLVKNILEKKRQELSGNQNEGKQIESFGNGIFLEKGSVYEADFITELIKKLIARLRETSNKEFVLIVDDIDRIDPDHIFRILNIFSVHFDLQEQNQNKFGIDKVILCCDVDNIRKIFHSKFGADVDFTGYIDKFYSTEIFHFDNRHMVSEAVSKILASIKPKKGILWKQTKDKSLQTSFVFLNYLLKSMVESKTFTIRQLLKLQQLEYLEKNFRINSYGREQSGSRSVYIFILFDFLISIYDSFNSLFKAINSTSFPSLQNISNNHIFGNLIVAYDMKSNKLQPLSNAKVKIDKFYIAYDVVNISTLGFDEILYGNIKPDSRDTISELNFKEVLLKSLENYQSIRGVQLE